MMLNVGLTFFSIVAILLLIPILIVMTLFCALFRNTLDQEQMSALKNACKDWLFFCSQISKRFGKTEPHRLFLFVPEES